MEKIRLKVKIKKINYLVNYGATVGENGFYSEGGYPTPSVVDGSNLVLKVQTVLYSYIDANISKNLSILLEPKVRSFQFKCNLSDLELFFKLGLAYFFHFLLQLMRNYFIRRNVIVWAREWGQMPCLDLCGWI